MDPLSALSIAASVIQFLQFSSSLVSNASRIYAKGALHEHVKCEAAAKRLIELTSDVKDSVENLGSLGTLSNDSKALKKICDNCIKTSGELLEHLDAFRVDGKHKHRIWKSFRLALESVCSTNEMDTIAKSLSEYKDELSLHLIKSIWKKANSLTLQQEEAITNLPKTVKAIETRLEERDSLQDDLIAKFESLILSNTAPHAGTQASILHALGNAQSVEIELLDSLRFPTISDRHVEIPEAHQATFKWVFADPSSCHGQWSNFVEWLEQGNGLYWINGKAGSGKSTLMRYIYDSGTTSQHLNTWAEGKSLQIAGFFFWNGGTLEQRSQIGLFRSLLYQVLQKCPDLVRHVFPSQWTERSSALANAHVLNWSLRALKDAFKRWIQSITKSSKLCLFIDGLDEYGGDQEEIAEYFKEISSSPHIKICVSSRPWIVFDEAFEDFPCLRLQDLTFPDIEAYVHAELLHHRRMNQRSIKAKEHASDLAHEIVTRADGVFLWVTLVVRSLLSGLRNHDGISDLRKRLHELPCDLSSLYTHMLNHVEPLYNEQAAQTFQIYDAMLTIKGEDRQITALELDLAITSNEMDQHQAPMDPTEMFFSCEHLDIHLKSRCAGLLEIYDTRNSKTFDLRSDKWNPTLFYCGTEPPLKVIYLHRTVRDFLRAEDVRATLLKHLAVSPDFEPNASALRSYVTRLKRSVCLRDIRCQDNNPSVGWCAVIEAMRYARKADAAGSKLYVGFMEELDNQGFHACEKFLHDWQIREGECWKDLDKTQVWRRLLLREATAHSLHAYVESRLKADGPSTSQWLEQPLLQEKNTLYNSQTIVVGDCSGSGIGMSKRKPDSPGYSLKGATKRFKHWE